MADGNPVGIASRRLRALRWHLAVYLVATIAALAATFALVPDEPVAIWFLLAWGVAVAAHVGWVVVSPRGPGG
jgi:hypothetical protein